MQSKSSKEIATQITGTAAGSALVRAASTLLIEVPCVNVERYLQLHQQNTLTTPPRGSTYINKLHHNHKLLDLLTGVVPNIIKNVLREGVRASAWVGVPIVLPHMISRKTLEEKPYIAKYSTVFSVILANGTLNTIFDRVRNLQVDHLTTFGTKLTSLQASKMIVDQYGFLGFLRGGSITYFYSGAFWGSYALANEFYTKSAIKFGYKPTDNLKTQIAVSTACGITAGIIIQPVQIVRNAVLNGALPPKISSAFHMFCTTQIAQVGVRGFFTGITYALPTQVIAANIAGVIIPRVNKYFQRS